jgi:lipid II:glycine glycyltransferase (peptidoglycan interpeptide bridge formation enzyme)
MENYKNLWQDALWEDFQKSLGRAVWRLEVPGASALLIQHALPMNLSWIEVPRGPIASTPEAYEDIRKKIEEKAKEVGAIFVRCSPFQDLEGPAASRTAFDRHPETSLILDLSMTEEEILAQMKPKGRYNIKVAEKHGVKVAPSVDIDAFYNLLKSTSNRDGFGVHPKSYYEKMLEQLGTKAQLLLATHEGQVVAGGIFVYLNEWGIYYYGASDHNKRNLMAPYLIQWTAIKESKNRGCAFYDFLGIAPEGAKNHAWAGVTDFKMKFGGRVENYPKAFDIVMKPFWTKLYSLYKKFR